MSLASDTKLGRCNFVNDPSVFDPTAKVKYCTCGLPEKHARHRPEPKPPTSSRRREEMSTAEAHELLASYGGWRKAVRLTHTDHGGDAEAFRRVQHAREVLRNAH